MNIFILFLLSFISNISNNGLSEDRTWDGGGGDQQWTNPLNWDNDLLPEFDADVYILTDDTVYVTGVDITIESITLEGGADLIVAEGAILQTYKGGPNGSDAIHMEGVDSTGLITTLTVSGSLLIDMHGASGDGLDMNKWTMTTVTPTGLLQIIHTGDDGIELADDFINQGTIIMQDIDGHGFNYSNVINDGATIWNAPGATVAIDTTTKAGVNISDDILFHNEGSISISNCVDEVLRGDTETFINEGTFIANGLVEDGVFSNNTNTIIQPGPDTASILEFESSFAMVSTTLAFDIFEPELGDSTSPGLNYDQLSILSGDIDLSECSFNISGNYIPIEGDEFVLIKNGSAFPIVNEFEGFPEGTTFDFNGVEMKLSYLGGEEGNSVVVSVVPTIVIVDNDNDGYAENVDCDDNNPDVNPGAMEIPNNGLDDDCMNGDSITASTFDLAALALKIYPNPVVKVLHLEYDGADEMSYRLADINGKVLLENIFRKEARLNLRDFADGVYMLHLNYQGQTTEKKIVKRKM